MGIYSWPAAVIDGIVIGAVGGTFAGVSVWMVQGIAKKIDKWKDERRVYKWLRENTSNETGNKFRSTRAIASWNNLTQDRTRYICSVHKKIYLSTGQQEEMWSIYDRGERSIYEERGILTV